MLLIGSRALLLRNADCLSRAPMDFDFIGSQEEYDQWYQTNVDKIKPTQVYQENNNTKWIVRNEKTICEFQIVQPGSSDELLVDLVKNDKETLETSFGSIPSLSILWVIKDSHRYKKFDTNAGAAAFWKTAIDWHMMKRAGAEMKPEYEAFSKLRQQESYAAQKHPKLNVSKESFFSDNGLDDTIVWDHDSIHISVAPNGIPAYTLYAKDNEPVLSDKNKFFACPRSVQLDGVVQEASVLAIERSKIPHKDTWTDRQAWMYALAKVSSTVCSGWFRKFSADNIFEVLKLYPENYWIKFQEDVKRGLVKPYTGTKY